ncbi:MAG TPA: sigma 54-interacting transcriptional regulator, partial [Thermoanaerobaculia bacterium]|nr:sigma 54-interacting transcriptional regulator [Thermoanaerobaculia bacterium]
MLVVDDEESVRLGLTLLLGPLGARIESAGSLAAALPVLERHRPHVVLLDLRLPDVHGLAGLELVCEKHPEAQVVMMTAYGTIETAVDALKHGALDFLTKPVAPEHLFHVLGRINEIRQLKNENRALRHELEGGTTDLFWGDSPAIRRLLEEARRIAVSEALVVLIGESGTGKGALARQIHRWSPRAEAPFINVNCAGLSRDLLESELFGHEKGAFTG